MADVTAPRTPRTSAAEPPASRAETDPPRSMRRSRHSSSAPGARATLPVWASPEWRTRRSGGRPSGYSSLVLGLLSLLIAASVLPVGAPHAAGGTSSPLTKMLGSSPLVTFQESGLAAGTGWSVTLSGTSSTAIAPLPNVFLGATGQLDFAIGSVAGYSAAPSAGTVVVNVSGLDVTVAITFLPQGATSHDVTFSESGLARSTPWTIVLNGSPMSANAPSSITFHEPDGSYAFRVAEISGYGASPSSGTIRVSGAAVLQSVEFTTNGSGPGALPVRFSESGLASGTVWSVEVAGSTLSTRAPSAILLNLTNGTHPFTVPGIDGYWALPDNGTLTVVGDAVDQAIQFSADIQHAVVIVLENYELGTVLAHGPYERYLWNTYGQASNFYGACHQSLPEYMAFTSGRSYSCSSIPIQSVTDLPDLIEQHGLTWAAYSESMPTPCDNVSSYPYTVYHNPFLYYADIVHNATRCDSHDVGSAVFNSSVQNGTLPTVSFYFPNNVNDCHDSTLASCDAWLQGFLAPMLNSTSPTVHALIAHTAFFLLYDEGGTNAGYSTGGIVNSWCQGATNRSLTVCGGHVWMTVVSPYSLGTNYTANATDYNLQSTVEWLFGLGNDGGYDGTSLFPAMSTLFTFSQNGLVAADRPNLPLPPAASSSPIRQALLESGLASLLLAVIGAIAWALRSRGGGRTPPAPPRGPRWPTPTLRLGARSGRPVGRPSGA